MFSISSMSGNLPNLDSLFVYDDPKRSEERLASVLEDPATAADPAYRCELLTRLARARGLQRRFDDAHATIAEARSIVCNDPSCQIRILLEAGRIFNSSGDPATAKPIFIAAFEFAQEHRLDGLAVDAAHMVAIVESGAAGLEWNERAIGLVEGSSDPEAKRWLGSLYNNTAWSHHDSGNYDRALELFEKAVTWREEQNQPRQANIGRWAVGRCLRSMNRLDEALAIQLQLSTEDNAGFVSEELGEIYLLLGRPEDASPRFKDAYAKLSQDSWLVANEPDRLERVRLLGEA
jgi:tetratricopeptide (TPR) repeat protein